MYRELLIIHQSLIRYHKMELDLKQIYRPSISCYHQRNQIDCKPFFANVPLSHSIQIPHAMKSQHFSRSYINLLLLLTHQKKYFSLNTCACHSRTYNKKPNMINFFLGFPFRSFLHKIDCKPSPCNNLFILCAYTNHLLIKKA